MKPILWTLFFITLILISIDVSAQTNFTISGTVADEKGAPLKGATVFISDSKIITATDGAGRFTLANLQPGSFRLSVTTVGYATYNKSILIRDKTVEINIVLKVKPIILNEVVIGKGKSRDDYYELFKDSFLGTTYNADQCVILNPKVLNFSTNKKDLMADADEFLIIENNSLGYRIRYLLKAFKYNLISTITSYDGDASFEELEGTEAQKKEWANNRLEAYNGSLMHFLRSVYANSSLKQGFMVHQVLKGPEGLYFDKALLDLKTITTVADSSFVYLSFTSIYAVYDPKKAAKAQVQEPLSQLRGAGFDNKSSLLKLYLDEAIIDSKGSYADYRSFLIQGNWSRKRLGDQLPFEYKPPVGENK